MPAAPPLRHPWLKLIARSPITGLSPWLVQSFLDDAAGFEVSVACALALSLVVVVLGHLARGAPTPLEHADVVFFAALAALGLVADDATRDWLDDWAGEVSSVALVVFSAGSLAVGHPFTGHYARAHVDPALQARPAFARMNEVTTLAWTLAFAVAAVSGAISNVVLDDSGEFWTGWIIQSFVFIAAIQFTLWYPGRVRAREAGDPLPPVSGFLLPLCAWLPLVGVLALLLDEAATWVCIVLIVAGIALTPTAVWHVRAAPSADR